MNLLSLHDVSLSFGADPVLEKANLTISSKQRICIIGRNGAGKSSLLKLLNKELEPDAGEVIRSSGLKVTKLQQSIPRQLEGNIYDVVVAGLDEKGVLLSEYHTVSAQLKNKENQAFLERLHVLQNKIDTLDAWPAQQQVESILSRMQLDPSKSLSSLSGEMIRRVLLAKALVSDPDILLLDEPTNHLDIATIEWLEEFLISYKKTLVFITHDRNLLKRVATQIVEVENGILQIWNCDYTQYLERKAVASEAKLKAEQLFDKHLAEEEKWIRKGIQARRTRNEGRVRKLLQMRKEKQQRREKVNKISLKEQQAHYSGKIVFDIQNLTYQYDGQSIIKDFSMNIMRGDKIGIIGKNGCGKTTFLKLLLEQLAPTHGEILRGTQLDYCYFDQQRQQLNEDKSVLENISDTGEYVTFIEVTH